MENSNQQNLSECRFPVSDFSNTTREQAHDCLEEVGALLEQLQANYVLLKYDTCSEMMLEELIELWKLNVDCLYAHNRNIWEAAYGLNK